MQSIETILSGKIRIFRKLIRDLEELWAEFARPLYGLLRFAIYEIRFFAELFLAKKAAARTKTTG
jgi:hypothetical protein